jgi:hypothetical protein
MYWDIERLAFAPYLQSLLADLHSANSRAVEFLVGWVVCLMLKMELP